MLSMRADEKGPVRQIYESANGIPHIPMPSATRLSRGKTPPTRLTALRPCFATGLPLSLQSKLKRSKQPRLFSTLKLLCQAF